MAKQLKKIKSFLKTPLLKNTMKIFFALILVVSLLMNLFTFVIPVVKYYGTSMSPTLKDGQILIVNKMAGIKNGDVVAFYYNNQVLVRRVIASGNEQITVDVFGTVHINGEEMKEPYIENKTLGQSNIDFPYNVPTNTYFVMGDNRDVAMDSRLSEIGVVSEDRLIGKVIFSMNPFRTIK